MKSKTIKRTQSMQNKVKKLEKKANWVRRKILEMAIRAGSGHIAPSFSCVEILVTLYCGGILRVNSQKPRWQGRDRFILSKGHVSIALYAILAERGFISQSCLKSFAQEGGRLGVHAEDVTPGVEVSTGSLGHGLSVGAGIALASKIDKKKNAIVVLMGDGECQEGSVWEAAMFSAHHQLNNLIVIIDYNELSATGFLKEYLDVEPFKEKWKAFGWEIAMVDGHCFMSLLSLFKKIHERSSPKPLVIIASTIKGKGISFMENKIIWHYRIPRGKELKVAQKELSYKK